MVVDLVVGELDRMHERIAGRFARAEPRARVREYVSGLVAGLERKNGWTLAEWAGEVSPDGMQRLLRSADWDVEGVRDDVRDYVIEQLGDRDGVLIADDTGFLKKAPNADVGIRCLWGSLSNRSRPRSPACPRRPSGPTHRTCDQHEWHPLTSGYSAQMETPKVPYDELSGYAAPCPVTAWCWGSRRAGAA